MINVNSDLVVSRKIASLKILIGTTKQLELIKQIMQMGEVGQEALLNFLIHRNMLGKKEIEILDGLIFEILYFESLDSVRKRLNVFFDLGLIDLDSSLRLNYQPLQELLIVHNFQEADKLTQSCLCSLAGLEEVSQRNWLYFTDITSIPSEDLLVIDKLWRLYSRGKFGFSIQRKIWISNNSNWEKFWHQIGWKDNGIARRYPTEFMWNINAPYGHLPLFNQLRGVQVLSALFKHIIWNRFD
uniref:GUN4-like domain-containing protein n=1 Tax=Melanthalia intermedia TaxID=172989 RepID=A0A345UAH2_9FLOR|nr:hypothetical protein [Melanthalia intermedia]AXI97458.1 hypothetical protein [Melanthalia intermedia]